MIHENITLAGKSVTLGYCYGTEIAYKDMMNEDIADIIQETIACVNAQPARMPDTKRSVHLVMAAIIAYYESLEKEIPVKGIDIMSEATPLELGTALGTIINLWAKFYGIPKGEPADKPQKGKGKGKN